MSSKNIPIALSTADPTTAAQTGESFQPYKSDQNGVLWFRPIANDTPITASSPNSDGLVPANLFALDEKSFLYTFNETSADFDRVRSLPSNSDSQSAAQEGLIGNVSRLQAYNGVSFDRVNTLPTDSDSQSADQTGLVGTVSRLQAYNPSTDVFDRIVTIPDDAAVIADSSIGLAGTVAKQLKRIPNSTNWEYEENNGSLEVFASAARTASAVSANLTNRNFRGFHLVLAITALTGSPSVSVVIRGIDEISGNTYTLLSAGPFTTISTTVLRLYPGLSSGTNVANDILPRVWQVQVNHSNADSITYSVGASLVL